MNSHRRYIRRGNGGQAMLSVVVFFLVAGLSLVLGSVSSLVPDIRAERDFSSSVQSYFTAEGGAEDAIIRIKKGLNPPTLYSFELGQSVAMISIDDIGGNEKKNNSSRGKW